MAGERREEGGEERLVGHGEGRRIRLSVDYKRTYHIYMCILSYTKNVTFDALVSTLGVTRLHSLVSSIHGDQTGCHELELESLRFVSFSAHSLPRT